MFATTVLLSTCVFSHNDEQSVDIVFPLEDESSQRLGMGAPVMGVLGGPCRNTPGYECDYGLKCHYYTTDGTSTSGRCVEDYNPPHHDSTGDVNQRCNRAPLAPCNYDYLQGVWNYGECYCRPQGQRTGEAGQRCNAAGPRCNRNNLRAHYVKLLPSGTSCTCEYFLGASEGQDSSTSQQDGDSDNQSTDEPRLGMQAPMMGREGEPCRNTPGDECDYGYSCRYYTTDGTSTSGTCVRDHHPHHHHTGGLNQQCNQAPLAPCNYDDLEGSWHHNQCTCRRRTNPQPRTGEAHGKCNRAPLSPCNHSNLQAHYVKLLPSGTACTCEYLLGASEGQDDNSDNQNTDGPPLGMEAPEMGREGEPCRNTPGDECDYGFTCWYYTTDGTSTSGTCVQDYQPDTWTGGLNEQCNQAPLAPCNDDSLKGVWNYGECTCRRANPQPRTGELNGKCNRAPLAPCNNDALQPHYLKLLPSGTSCTCVRANPQPRTGEANGKCNRAPLSPCNHSNLQAHYVKLLPSGTACTCEYFLGESDEKSTGGKLGMAAPEMGGEGEPCRNTPGDECDNGMFCKYTNHGSWKSGVCLRQYMPVFGKKGQPCNNGVGQQQCDTGLYCKTTWHGSFSTNVCVENEVPRGQEGQQCNLLGSTLPECYDENDFCKEVHLLPTGTTYICTRKTAKLGDRCGSYARKVGRPTECDNGLICKEHRMYPSGTAQICEEPKHQGAFNEPCRSNLLNPCDGDLVCNYFGSGGPTCIYWLGNSAASAAPAPGN